MSEQWPDLDSSERNSGFSLKKRIIYGLISLVIILGLTAPLSLPFLRNGLSYIETFFQSEPEAPQSERAFPTVEAIEEVSEETAVSPADAVRADPSATVEPADSDPALPTEPTTPSPTAEVSLSINRIAYINSDGDVATISPDGTNDKVLTSGEQFYQFPAWSPNGRYLAAIGASRGQVGIYLLEDRSGSERPLYSSRDKTPFYLYWSPNSEEISFLAQHDETPMTLRLVDVDNDDVEQSEIVLAGGPLYWDWSADGESLFVHSALEDEERMGFFTAAGEMVDGGIEAPGAFQAPSISGDGRYVAYAQINPAGFSEMVVADIDAQTEVRTRHNGVVAMGWSPVANQLAYINNATPEGFSSIGPLRLYDAESDDTMLLSGQNVLAFFWSPNGRYVAFYTLTNGGGDSEINASRLFFEQKTRQAAKSAAQRRPAFDLTVVDVITGEGRVLVTNIELSALFITQFLPFFDQYAMSHSLWSPGSDAFLVPYNDSGTARIAAVNIDGGQVRDIAQGFVAFWSHQ